MRDRTEKSNVRPDIQGLRAVAVLAVVIFHSSEALPGGFVGVDIFFVISGFVILSSLLREHAKTGRISLKRFYIRRFKRLIPALALVVLTTLVLSAFILSPLGPQQTLSITAIAAMFSVANVAIALNTGDYFDARAELNPLLHTWSLSVEEQFYFVFPIALVVGLALAGQRRIGGWVVVVLGTVLSLAAMLITTSNDQFIDSPLFGFYSPVVRAWEFGVGAILALWLFGRRRAFGRRFSIGLITVGTICIGLSLSSVGAIGSFPGPITALPVIGSALVILGGHGARGATKNPFAWFPLRTIGDWSYSIYLWHWPFVSLAGIIWPGEPVVLLYAVAVSFGPAILSFYLLENRLRFAKLPSLRSALLLVGGTLAVPLSAAGAVWGFAESLVPQVTGQSTAQKQAQVDHIGNSEGFGIDPADVQRVADERPPGYTFGCHGPPSLVDDLGVCTWDFPDSREQQGPIYLIGDSNAAHFTEGLRLAAAKEGRDLVVATASNCALTLGAVPQMRYPEGCAHWQRLVIEHLSDSPPGTVVLAGLDGFWLGETHSVASSSGEIFETEASKLDLFEQSTVETLWTLQGLGHEAVLVQTVPQWAGEYEWSLDSCSLAETLAGCIEEQTVAAHYERAGPVIGALERAAVTGNSVTVDFIDEICPESVCRTAANGQYVYRDGSHITNAFSQSLAPVWREHLNSVEGDARP